jgi:hypothetical protein
MIYGRSSCNPIMTWANFWIIDSWDALGSCQRPSQFLHGPPATKLVLAMGGMSWSSSDGVKQLKTLRSFERCLATSYIFPTSFLHLSYIFPTSSHWILLKYIQHAIGLVPCHAMSPEIGALRMTTGRAMVSGSASPVGSGHFDHPFRSSISGIDCRYTLW